MAELLKGGAVAAAMKDGIVTRAAGLRGKGVSPCLAIVRVGERADDLAYESGVVKKFEGLGIDVVVRAFPESVSQADFEQAFGEINADSGVHGILLFRPLPEGLDEERIKRIIDPAKDVDGTSCTALAVMEIFKYYGIGLAGKKVALIGRSMVVGKPLAALLIEEDATVTICHSKTVDLAGECRRADVVIAAAGVPRMVKKEYIGQGAVVVDVGINTDADGVLCGDVDFEDVEALCSAITPVPGGVGSVTTSVLAGQVLRAAEEGMN